MYVAQTRHLEMVEKDLVEFIHRVATDKKASPAEIAILPEIARVLYDQFPAIGRFEKIDRSSSKTSSIFFTVWICFVSFGIEGDIAEVF